MTGIELADLLIDGERRWNVPERQVGVERLGIHVQRQAVAPRDRLDLRRKHEPRAVARVEQRLDAEPVARHHERLPPLVPDGQREHPAQPLQTVDTTLFVQMNDDFDIAAGAEPMPSRFQLAAQFEMVVDLAVAHDRDQAVFARNRLMTTGGIDDRQARHADRRRPAGDVYPLVVGAAVPERRDHPRHFFAAGAVSIRGPGSRYSTHSCFTRAVVSTRLACVRAGT